MAFLILVVCVPGTRASALEDRPNFLLITCEDMGPDLGCFGDETAITPRLDALAAEGVRYTRAFASAPVCSPARTGLFFSRYQASLGGSNHRSRASVGEDLDGFAAVLRNAGYYTTNGPKLDINVTEYRAIAARAFDSGGGWWDEGRGGKPFMVIRNYDTTHQSRTSVWPREKYERNIRSKLRAEEIHDPADMIVPPYYPDTPEVRTHLARYADCVTLMDRQVGNLLDRLERDGLADDTIVIFFSDHGAGMTGHKKIALARGTRVPMIVRIPAKWSHLATAGTGETDDRLVSFVDVGPTLLSIAGLAIPEGMHGVPFLGCEPGRELVFAARDRIDEDIDHGRMVTDGRWVYSRSYFPDRPFFAPSGYASTAGVYKALEAGLAAGTLPPDAARMMAEPRGAEMLFDLETDPMELRDVSDDLRHRARLTQFREALRAQMLETGDLGLIPEAILRRAAGDLPVTTLADRPDLLPLERVVEVAELVGRDRGALIGPMFWTADAHEAVRYWAIRGLGTRDVMLGGSFADARRIVIGALEDASPTVRIAAARACLAAPVERARAALVLVEAVGSESYWDALLAAREGQLLGMTSDAFVSAVRAAADRWDRYELGEVARMVEDFAERMKKGAAGAAPSVP